MSKIRYFKNRRGQAAVIGGIVIASLVFSILLPLILLYQRTAEYISSQALIELNFINEKLRESLSVRGSQDASTITVNNTGSTIVTPVRLWLMRGAKIEYIVDLIPPNSIVLGLTVDGKKPDKFPPTLKPGSTLKISLASLRNPQEVFLYIESDRGVLHPRERAEPLIPPRTEIEEIIRREVVDYLAETQFGPITLWFFSFTYYNVSLTSDPRFKDQIPGRLLNYPGGGLPGFEVPANKRIAFVVNITNYDPRGRAIVITSDSYMKMYHEKLGLGQYINFNITSVKENGEIEKEIVKEGGKEKWKLPFNPLRVEYGEKVSLVFVGVKDTPAKGSGYVTIVIQGYFEDGEPVVQNIPAVGIRTI